MYTKDIYDNYPKRKCRLFVNCLRYGPYYRSATCRRYNLQLGLPDIEEMETRMIKLVQRCDV